MKLSDLKTGEKGIIVKVLGHGGFRKRIIEMGFIKGKEVEVLLNAPLQDPVKYKLMGYEVSLRHHEAEMIEVVSSLEFRTESVEFLRPSGSKRAELERATAEEWYERGNAFRKESKWHEAINCYIQAIELDPDSPAVEAKRMLDDIMAFYCKDMYNP